MKDRGFCITCLLLGSLCALAASRAGATGVPIEGFLPIVGIGLSIEDNEFSDDPDDDFDTFAVYHTDQPTNSMMLGAGGTPHYDMALLDTGAGFSLITTQAYDDFNVGGARSGNPDGFFGTESIVFGGATGQLVASINDPLGLYVGGLQDRSGSAPLTMNLGAVKGQTNTSLITVPPNTELPNVVGLTFAMRYATYIRSDLPQIFEVNGQTVRTPYIDFLELGSGGQGITRRAPMELRPGSGFTAPPTWFYNFEDFDIDHPQEDPSLPTLLQSGSGGAFLNVTAQDNGQSLGNTQFLFDTGASVTIVSELSAIFLGYEGEPEFTISVVGSGGTAFDVPGFFLDQFTIFATGGNVVLNNVPVLVLDVTDPGDPGNVVDGIVGMNLLSGRNLVFDPEPSTGQGGVGPSLYISDPVTTQKNWTTTAATGTFGTDTNWNAGTTPNNLGIANVRHVSGGNQTAVVAANATVWELNVSGTATQTMTVQVQNGVTLQTFSGVNIEQGGVVRLQNGTLDAQYVEVFGGTLTGSGTIETGSGPLPGQVENRGGTIAPGDTIGQLGIIGRFANIPGGTLAFDLGGDAIGQYDQIIVEGSVAAGGALAVSLVNQFTPSINDSFTLITATAGMHGAFDTLLLPSGYQWDVAYGNDDIVLTVVGIGLAGDFNGDDTVDAADYAWWRKNNGTPQQYQNWQANFGMSSPGGAGSGQSGVPEPATPLLFAFAACVFATTLSRLTLAARSASSTTP
jgi:hypothetical protein